MLPRPLIDAFMDALAPQSCAFCGVRTCGDQRTVCRGCFADLPWQQSPLRAPVTGLECLIVPLVYAFPIDAAIRALKFRRQLFYGPAFAQLLCAFSELLPDDVDAVVPVPLHWRRQWFRGFNQALEIARPVATHLAVPVDVPARRRRATKPQSGLSATDRASNLRGAFAIRREIGFRHVLLIDDVVTTGATIGELARAMLRSGAMKVSAMAVARS